MARRKRVLELGALYDHCIFNSHERSATHSLVANELCDHHLRWHGGAVDTRMCKFDTNRLSLYSLSYGAEVEIYPIPYEEFSLVHFSLAQSIEIQADGQGRQVRPGGAIVSSPRRNIRLHWSRNAEQLILRVPHAVLKDAASQIRRRRPFRDLRGLPGLMLSEAASQQWQMQLQTFMLLNDQVRKSQIYEPWLAHVELGMAMFLALQADDAPSGDDDAECRIRPIEERQARRRLDRLYECALANICRPLTLADLANAAALSERQLNALCHEHFGLSPMAWLRGLRLDAVRAALLANPGCDLTDIAMLHGFYHLGRFSAYYRARFGELPRETRQSARNG